VRVLWQVVEKFASEVQEKSVTAGLTVVGRSEAPWMNRRDDCMKTVSHPAGVAVVVGVSRKSPARIQNPNGCSLVFALQDWKRELS